MPITIKASAGAIKEAAEGSDLENIDFDGYHVFELMKAEVKESKAGNDQIVCQYKLIGLGREGKKPTTKYWPLRDYVQLEGASTEWKRAEFLTAVNDGKTKLEIEDKRPGTVIGKKVICRLELEEYTDQNGKTRTQSKIAKVLPFIPPIGGMETEELDDEGDIPDDQAIAEEEVVVEETIETETTEDYTPWDADSLKAAGKEKIKEVADSFGVSIVKGMTAGDVIAAVLEAQAEWMKSNGASEGAEVLSDEEPF